MTRQYRGFTIEKTFSVSWKKNRKAKNVFYRVINENGQFDLSLSDTTLKEVKQNIDGLINK